MMEKNIVVKENKINDEHCLKETGAEMCTVDTNRLEKCTLRKLTEMTEMGESCSIIFVKQINVVCKRAVTDRINRIVLQRANLWTEVKTPKMFS